MVNKVILIGNLGMNPEVHQFETNSVARFSLATSDTYIDKNGERQSTTEWHRVVVWGKQAENAQRYLKKGSKVYVEGKITYNKYTDKNNIERTATEIKADLIRYLDSAGGASAGGGMTDQTASEPSQAGPDPDTTIDDLPF